MLGKQKVCYISCDCGCDEGMIARSIDGEIYLSFVSSDFYTKQQCLCKYSLTWKLLRGRRVVKDIVCTKEDLQQLKDFLLSAECHDGTETNNDSHISIQYDEDFGYIIYLVSDMKRRDVLKLKNHRIFEITLSKKERDRIVKRINTLTSLGGDIN